VASHAASHALREAPAVPRRFPYTWLSLAISSTAFVGFSFTYFGPLFRGVYPKVAPAVHVHGWTFFLWFILLPLQASLVRTKRVAVHRWIGLGSIVLASAMVFTGVLVLGTQLDAALKPDGSPFWRFLGLAILTSLLLFAGFYSGAVLNRRRREAHKRLIILASTGALGAATFRITTTAFGFTPTWQVVGVFLPNVFIVVAMMIDFSRDRAIHRIYPLGLVISVAATSTALLLRSTTVGLAVMEGLAWIGRLLARDRATVAAVFHLRNLCISPSSRLV
jgi:hypothetical protein